MHLSLYVTPAASFTARFGKPGVYIESWPWSSPERTWLLTLLKLWPVHQSGPSEPSKAPPPCPINSSVARTYIRTVVLSEPFSAVELSSSSHFLPYPYYHSSTSKSIQTPPPPPFSLICICRSSASLAVLSLAGALVCMCIPLGQGSVRPQPLLLQAPICPI